MKTMTVYTKCAVMTTVLYLVVIAISQSCKVYKLVQLHKESVDRLENYDVSKYYGKWYYINYVLYGDSNDYEANFVELMVRGRVDKYLNSEQFK